MGRGRGKCEGGRVGEMEERRRGKKVAKEQEDKGVCEGMEMRKEERNAKKGEKDEKKAGSEGKKERGRNEERKGKREGRKGEGRVLKRE